MDYFTSLGMTPYEAYCKIMMENALEFKSMLTPLASSYTQSSDGTNGAPEKSLDDLSESGLETREKEKNAETKAAK